MLPRSVGMSRACPVNAPTPELLYSESPSTCTAARRAGGRGDAFPAGACRPDLHLESDGFVELPRPCVGLEDPQRHELNVDLGETALGIVPQRASGAERHARRLLHSHFAIDPLNE